MLNEPATTYVGGPIAMSLLMDFYTCVRLCALVWLERKVEQAYPRALLCFACRRAYAEIRSTGFGGQCRIVIPSCPSFHPTLNAYACAQRPGAAASLWLRLARLPPPASRVWRSSHLRDTLAVAPGLLAHYLVTETVKFVRLIKQSVCRRYRFIVCMHVPC